MNIFRIAKWFNNITIARKLYFTVGTMALLIGVELFTLSFCLNTLSALRAYVGGEGLWSKAQKDAVFHLYRYAVTGTDEDYVLFKEYMNVPIGDSSARTELIKKNPDKERARQGFIQGRNHPNDVDGMIDLFVNFSDVSYIKKAIDIWGEAEPIVMQLLPIAERLREEISSGSPSASAVNELLQSVDVINQQLTQLEDQFSYTLGEGSRWMEDLVLKLLFVVALTVEITGLLLALSINRGIQRGLTQVIRASDSLAVGMYDTRVTVSSRDEIGMVAAAFNRMAAALEHCISGLARVQDRLRMLVESAPDAIVIIDEAGKIKIVNAQAERLFDYHRHELLGEGIALLLGGDNSEQRATDEKYSRAFLHAAAAGSVVDLRCRKKSGEIFPVEIRVSLIETDEGPLVSASIRDVSERELMLAQRTLAEAALKQAYDELRSRVNELAETNLLLRREIIERERAEAELKRAFALLDQHVNNTPLGVIEWEREPASQQLRVRRWSGQTQAIFGWSEKEVLERSAQEFGLIYEGDTERAADSERHLTEGRCPNNSMNLRCYTKERQLRHCHWYNSALHCKDTGKITILSLIEDVTERVTALEDVYRLAHHDTLTGLPNRTMLRDRLCQALSVAKRHRQGVAVMMVDLDHFKNVNDTLGHPVGDELLQSVCARLCERLRATDTLARVGGDEFVLIETDLADPNGASTMGRKVLAELEEPFFVRGSRLHVSASIGITLFPWDATDPDLLLRNADIALYRAKREGRGRYRFYSRDMDLELKAARSIEDGLRHAIERDGLELFYQPIFSLADGRTEGVEALVRWVHPGGGHVSPESFISTAEISGLIVPLGEWIIREACQQAHAWRAAGWAVRVAINISVVQLKQPEFARTVGQILADCGLDGYGLEFEITENVFLDPSKQIITKTLQQLADIGIGLAIDDFGTGYSSLGYLKHFPFNRIKIDGSFVHDIGVNRDAEAIVKAIIGLGRSLGKSVTAEGVETPAQFAFLRANTCDEVQGFLLAQPRPAHEIREAMMRTARIM